MNVGDVHSSDCDDSGFYRAYVIPTLAVDRSASSTDNVAVAWHTAAPTDLAGFFA